MLLLLLLLATDGPHVYCGSEAGKLERLSSLVYMYICLNGVPGLAFFGLNSTVVAKLFLAQFYTTFMSLIAHDI